MKLASLLPISTRRKLAAFAADYEAKRLILAAKKVRIVRQKGMPKQ